MIVRFPETPPVDGPLQIPRPSVYLIGSYGYDATWAEEAARQLDRHVGCVFWGGGVPMDPEVQMLKVTWSLMWLQAVDLVACWIESAPWAEFELGFALGRARSSACRAPVIGTCVAELLLSLDRSLSTLGFSGHIRQDFHEWITAVEVGAKGLG